MHGGNQMLQKFETYQLAIKLYRQVEGLRIKSYPRDHLQRACLSVALNLAEGSAKPTVKERRRFYGISLASLRFGAGGAGFGWLSW